MPDSLLIPYSELGFGDARPYLFLHMTGRDGRGRVFPDLTFDVAPFFVHGCQHALWAEPI